MSINFQRNTDIPEIWKIFYILWQTYPQEIGRTGKSSLQKKGERKQFDLANLDYQNNGSSRLAWKCSKKSNQVPMHKTSKCMHVALICATGGPRSQLELTSFYPLSSFILISDIMERIWNNFSNYKTQTIWKFQHKPHMLCFNHLLKYLNKQPNFLVFGKIYVISISFTNVSIGLHMCDCLALKAEITQPRNQIRIKFL